MKRILVLTLLLCTVAAAAGAVENMLGMYPGQSISDAERAVAKYSIGAGRQISPEEKVYDIRLGDLPYTVCLYYNEYGVYGIGISLADEEYDDIDATCDTVLAYAVSGMGAPDSIEYYNGGDRREYTWDTGATLICGIEYGAELFFEWWG